MEQIMSKIKSRNRGFNSKKEPGTRIKESDIREEYELLLHSALGRGATGEVFTCRCKRTQTLYALKIRTDDKRGKKEIAFHTLCQHSQYVVPIIDVFRCPGHHPNAKPGNTYLYIVMELHKQNLFTYIRNHGGVKEETAVHLIRQIVAGLQTLHERGIIHRDLKPDNILISEDGEEGKGCWGAKLCDFGSACEENSRPTLPEYTPFYVAPEVLCKDSRYNHRPSREESKPYDHRCDIWALGVLLYCVLSGAPPFFSEIRRRPLSHVMVQNIRDARFKFDLQVWREISPQAKDLISNLIKADPRERLTLQQVLEHPWMSINDTLSHVNL